MRQYIYERNYDLIDLLIPKKSRFEVTINDGASGDTGDEYVIAVNEKPQYGGGFRDSSNEPFFERAAVVEDSTPGTDDSSTIASDLQSEINDTYDVASATVNGNTITIEPDDDYPYMDLHVETYTSDDEGEMVVSEVNPEAYEVLHAANWDATFSTMETVPREGKKDPNAQELPAHGSESSSLNPYTRFRFDPSTYGLNDDHLQFFKVAPVVNGVTQTAGPIIIVLSSEHLYEEHPSVLLKGNAPIANDVSGALELNLPYQTTSMVIKNVSDPAETVYVSFGSGDTEWELAQGETLSDNKISSWDIKVRTDSSAGSPATVQIYATINTERQI